jgi:hypothetical protein
VCLLVNGKIAETRIFSGTPLISLSVYVDIDAVRLYLAGKASCWHAGVLLAAPTVKRGGVKKQGVTVTAFKNLNEKE